MTVPHRVAPLQTIHASRPFEKVEADITKLSTNFPRLFYQVCECVPYERPKS